MDFVCQWHCKHQAVHNLIVIIKMSPNVVKCAVPSSIPINIMFIVYEINMDTKIISHIAGFLIPVNVITSMLFRCFFLFSGIICT